ncbi:glycosyltransferase family protein [Paenibacillus sp. strain BS8-2]
MKVLHLPYGIGMSTLSQALRNLGVNATSLSLRDNRYSYLADLQVYFTDYPASEAKEKKKALFEEAMEKYDIFHFHFGETFYPDKRDLDMLKTRGKKLVMNHRGSEVRMLSVAQGFHNPYVRVKSSWRKEDKIRNNLSYLSHYIDHAIVNDHELLSYVEPYYKKVHILPHAIEAKKFQTHYPLAGTKPHIVHAPTHQGVKGSEFIMAAVDQLREDGFDFDFTLIEGYPHQEAMELYQKATIVIDQLLIGAYGHVSVEAMAMGKPVVCFIRDDLKVKYPHDLPIISANPDTVYHVLKAMLQNPATLPSIGERSRNYALQHHDLDTVAHKLIQIYREL